MWLIQATMSFIKYLLKVADSSTCPFLYPSYSKFFIGDVAIIAGLQSISGHVDGFRTSSQFSSPMGILYHPHQNALFICDCDNNKLRKLSLNGSFLFAYLHHYCYLLFFR